MNKSTNECIHLSVYIYIYKSKYIYIYIHMFLCMYVCMYVCMCLYIYIYIYIYLLAGCEGCAKRSRKEWPWPAVPRAPREPPAWEPQRHNKGGLGFAGF